MNLKCETCGGELRLVGIEGNKRYCICTICGQDVWLDVEKVKE